LFALGANPRYAAYKEWVQYVIPLVVLEPV
jgi:hypothetical protein